MTKQSYSQDTDHTHGSQTQGSSATSDAKFKYKQ